MKRKRTLPEKYPDSEPCSCAVCLSYCRRPGWWTVDEAAAALEAGHGTRMMLEMGPGNAFAVLAPAFKGNEGEFSAQEFANNGCTFLRELRCELHGTGHQPLECRFSHHEREGQGPRCHADIERQWNSAAGRELVVRWSNETGFWQRRQTGAPGEVDPNALHPAND